MIYDTVINDTYLTAWLVVAHAASHGPWLNQRCLKHGRPQHKLRQAGIHVDWEDHRVPACTHLGRLNAATCRIKGCTEDSPNNLALRHAFWKGLQMQAGWCPRVLKGLQDPCAGHGACAGGSSMRCDERRGEMCEVHSSLCA